MRKVWIALLIASCGLASMAWAMDHFSRESAPVPRGAEYALQHGCMSCHADKTHAALHSAQPVCAYESDMDWPRPDEAQRESVKAYFAAIRMKSTLDERLQWGNNNSLTKGEALARKYYCFQCHGIMGQGGFRNVGSLKGYVPGFFGRDFRDLTRGGNPDSVRAWIEHGVDTVPIAPAWTGWIAEFFLNRQAIGMPRYGSLPDAELDALVDYVLALNDFGPMNAEALRSYDRHSREADH